jgi:acyl-coenzyme A thioesterase PaaI-like protein
VTLPPDPSRAYPTFDPPIDDRRAAKHRLVARVKDLVEEVALLDPAQHDVADVDAMTAEVESLRARLAAADGLRRFGGLGFAPPDDAALRERSGIIGRSNPLAPPLHLEMGDDGVTRGHATYTAAYEGPPGCLHGGFVAAAFDDLMGFAQMASGIAGFTGTLTIRMMQPTPLHERIDYEAHVERVDGRKIFVRGSAWHGDVQLADAEIVFIQPKRGTPAPRR